MRSIEDVCAADHGRVVSNHLGCDKGISIISHVLQVRKAVKQFDVNTFFVQNFEGSTSIPQCHIAKLLTNCGK